MPILSLMTQKNLRSLDSNITLTLEVVLLLAELDILEQCHHQNQKRPNQNILHVIVFEISPVEP